MNGAPQWAAQPNKLSTLCATPGHTHDLQKFLLSLNVFPAILPKLLPKPEAHRWLSSSAEPSSPARHPRPDGSYGPQFWWGGAVESMAPSSGGGARWSYGPQFWWGGSSSGPCTRQGRCNGRMGDRCTATLLATLPERSACERLCVTEAMHAWDLTQGQLPPCGQAMATATSRT